LNTVAAVAVVIPAWNEPQAIGPVLAEVPPGVAGRVYVVVGSAEDPTAEVARAHQAQVLVPSRSGYGAACWTGAQAALADGAEVVAFLDGDYSDPPAELPRLLAPLLTGQADLALGLRAPTRAASALPLHARLGNRLVLFGLRRLLGRSFADLPSYKAVTAQALRRLDMREMTYGWTVEMLVKAARADLRLAEIPMDYRPRLGGRSKVSGSLRGTLGAGWKLCACAFGYASWSPARPSG
jgi:glycosyltransferase involved in cell wall biosynthesis